MWTVSLRFDAKVRVSKANDTEAERKEEGSYRGRPSMQMKISSSSSRFTLLLLFSLLPGKNRFPACSRTYRKLGESIAFRSISDFFSLSERKKRKKNTRILLSIHFFPLKNYLFSRSFFGQKIDSDHYQIFSSSLLFYNSQKLQGISRHSPPLQKKSFLEPITHLTSASSSFLLNLFNSKSEGLIGRVVDLIGDR